MRYRIGRRAVAGKPGVRPARGAAVTIPGRPRVVRIGAYPCVRLMHVTFARYYFVKWLSFRLSFGIPCPYPEEGPR